MEKIELEIDGKEEVYFVKQKGDLTVRDWFNLYDTLRLREYKEVEMANGEVEKEEVPHEEESEDFRFDKLKKICMSFCDVPESYYDEFIGLVERIYEMMPDLDYRKVARRSFGDGQVEYYRSNMKTISFQEWCDVESCSDFDRLAPVALLFKEKGKKYDRFMPDLSSKLEILYSKRANDYMGTVDSVFSEIDAVRKSFPLVYEADYGRSTSKSPNMTKHLRDFKWYDVLMELAEGGVFGTLPQLRKAAMIEVMDYLNVKRSRDAAEARDFQLNNKQIG